MSDLKGTLPFEEWKSRLLARGSYCNGGGTLQICAWELDGDQEQWMMNEYTTFPHFGKVMAAALDPVNHKAETRTAFMFSYYDPTGNLVFANDPETCAPTGRKPSETFPNASFDVLYYDYVMWVNEFDRACELAYEMYRRRRLPTAKDWEEIIA